MLALLAANVLLRSEAEPRSELLMQQLDSGSMLMGGGVAEWPPGRAAVSCHHPDPST